MKQLSAFLLMVCLTLWLGPRALAQEHRPVEIPPDPSPAEIPSSDEEGFAEREATMEIGYLLRYNRPYDLLSEQNYRSGFGFGVEMLTVSRPLANFLGIQWGAQFSYDRGGEESFPLTMGYPYRGQSVDLELSNENVGLHGVLRLITPDRFPIQIYVQGLVGSRLFYSQETLVINDHADDDYCPEPVNVNRSFTLSYGAGGGLRLALGPYSHLDLRATYLTGSNARFIDLDQAYVVEQNLVDYPMAEAARTDGFTFSVGVSMPLDSDDGCTPSRDALSAASALWWGGGGGGGSFCD